MHARTALVPSAPGQADRGTTPAPVQELTCQVVDDFDWCKPVIIKEVPVSTQHAELQSKAATMVWASAFSDHGQVRGRQASSAAPVRPRSGSASIAVRRRF